MNHEIPLAEAVAMAAQYREMREAILGNDFKGQDILPKSETFDRAALDTLLAQDSCAQIRIYYGMDGNNRVHAILVGVDEKDNDMIPGMPRQGVVMEDAKRCPNDCPPQSVLNQ